MNLSIKDLFRKFIQIEISIKNSTKSHEWKFLSKSFQQLNNFPEKLAINSTANSLSSKILQTPKNLSKKRLIRIVEIFKIRNWIGKIKIFHQLDCVTDCENLNKKNLLCIHEERKTGIWIWWILSPREAYF
jgi:hypothetical protein